MKELIYLHKDNVNKYILKYYSFDLEYIFNHKNIESNLKFICLNKIIYCTIAKKINAYELIDSGNYIPVIKNFRFINNLIQNAPTILVCPYGKLKERS